MPDARATPPPFDPAVVEFLLAWQALEVASRHVRERFAHEAGLSLSDFQALVFLSAKNGSTPKAVGGSLGMTTGATTALIDRLENALYVTREPHPTDRRSTLVFLTVRGLDAATGAGAVFVTAAEGALTVGDRMASTDLFRRLARALEA